MSWLVSVAGVRIYAFPEEQRKSQALTAKQGGRCCPQGLRERPTSRVMLLKGRRDQLKAGP